MDVATVNDNYLLREYLQTLKDKHEHATRWARLDAEARDMRARVDADEQYLMQIEAEFKRRYGAEWTRDPTYQASLAEALTYAR